MRKYALFLFYFVITLCQSSIAQGEYIRSKEGRPVLNRRQLIASCIRSLNKTSYDNTAVAICECQTDKLDRRFTNKQFQKYTHSGIIDVSALVKEDSLLAKIIDSCFINSGQTLLLQAEGFENEFIASCIKGIKTSTEKTLDSNRVKNFCSCRLELIKAKKISDAEMETLNNPNSLLFYEMMYKCGDPFVEMGASERNWNQNAEKDIKGPQTDTVKILTLNGMTYLKLKVGSMIQIWLLDTGASDMLINKDMEVTLRKENIITDANYLGIGEYEMANGVIDTCRKYMVSNIQIGGFAVNNIIVAVTDKGKRIIAGKALLNKFSKWILNNRENTLILTR